MKLLKIQVFFTIILTVLVSFTSCNTTNQNRNDIPNSKTQDILFPSLSSKNYIIDADIFEPAETIEDLYDKSNCVVVGSVINSYNYNHNDVLDFSCANVKIEKVLKGDLSTGDTVNIEEVGTQTEKYNISIGGAPLLKEKMRVVLFLTQPSDVIQGFPAYGIVDCVTGKFFYDNNKKIYPAINFAESFSSKLSDISGSLTEKEFINKLEACKS